MNSPHAKRWPAAMSDSTMQDGQSHSSLASNPALPASEQTETSNVTGPPTSPYYSPPPTFMPPESPNTLSYAPHSASASFTTRPIDIYTRSSQDNRYRGVTLAPGQRGSLTAYGQLATSILPSNGALKGVDGREQPLSSLSRGVDHSLEGLSRQTSAAEASQQKAHQGAQLLHANLQPDRGRISFSDLASQRGLRQWTDEKFDDRWVLRPDEMRNVDPRRRSIITISPSPQSSLWSTDDQVRAQEAYAQARAQAQAIQAQAIQAQAIQAQAIQAQAIQAQLTQTQASFVETIFDRRARLRYRKATAQDVSNAQGAVASYAARSGLNSSLARSRNLTPILYGDSASLREVKKLVTFFREHADDRFLLPSALPFSQHMMGEYLRESIFGPKDARSLMRTEREQLILYGSNPITRDELRKFLLVVVDGMAEDMTSQHRDMARDPRNSRNLGQNSLVNTTPTGSSPPEGFDVIHHHLINQKKQNLVDRQSGWLTGQLTSSTAPRWIPGEQQPDRTNTQESVPGALQWIPDGQQMDRQTGPKMASSTLPSGPHQRPAISNAHSSIPHERQMVSLVPPAMQYPGHGLSHYSQPISHPTFNPYYQYLTDPRYEQQQHQQFFSIPNGPYHQMGYFSQQPFAPPHFPQPYPVHQYYGQHQYNPFFAAAQGPPVLRPAAPQRLAPKALRAGALAFTPNTSNTMGLSAQAPRFTPNTSNTMGHSAQAPMDPRPETAQALQLSNHSVPSGSARILQTPKVSAPGEPAHPRQISVQNVSPSAAQSHPLSTLASSSAQLPQPSRYSSGHEIVQTPQPVQPSLGSGPVPIVVPTIRPLIYQVGSDITKPLGPRSPTVKLKDLTRHGKPSFAIATNEGIMPFAQTAKECKPAQWGVVKISNIPYALTKGEVTAFFGRNAKLVSPEYGSPIHIIMDRSTGKTNDCYVEFFSTADAQAAVNRLIFRGHQLKLGTAPGDRIVTVAVSSQDVLLKELFPRAKNVTWKDGMPVIVNTDEPFNSGFKAFITGEEMVMLVRHAEQPHRSGYTQKCPQRTYETMISTLVKFPWHSVQHYTIATRNQMFAATRDQIKTLVANLKRGGGPHLSQGLLTELMFAGLNAPGFSEKQRWDLVQAAGYVGGEVKLSPLMKWWPWETLCRKVGSDEDVIEYYATLFKANPATKPDGENPFGILVSTAVVDFNSITMEMMGRIEWGQFKTLLRKVLD